MTVDPASSCDCAAPGSPSTTDRARQLRDALRLEYLTVGWNVVEGLVAVTAALAARSVALLGFGLDSFVETASALILVWRLGTERDAAAAGRALDVAAVERLDRQAHRLVGLSLFVLAAYVAFDALGTLWRRERPGPSLPGIAITALSLGVMVWLARAKRRAADRLASRALAADSFQTTACWWLSLITLGGVGLNLLFGWWWADPLAALAMTWFLAAEGRQAWRGEDCGCRSPRAPERTGHDRGRRTRER